MKNPKPLSLAATLRWSVFYLALMLLLTFIYSKPQRALHLLFSLPVVALTLWGLITTKRLLFGYYITHSGNAADGHVEYHERGQRLELYFQRFPFPFTISIPTDAAWQRDMPDWAKNRKTKIVAQVKRHFKLTGKNAEYTETDTVLSLPRSH